MGLAGKPSEGSPAYRRGDLAKYSFGAIRKGRDESTLIGRNASRLRKSRQLLSALARDLSIRHDAFDKHEKNLRLVQIHQKQIRQG